MPTYEYRCANGHTFEVTQRMADDPVTACQECGATVERVFHPIAVHFKGSGFYTTDYARKGSKSSGDGKPASESKDSKDKGSKGESKDSGSDGAPKTASTSD